MGRVLDILNMKQTKSDNMITEQHWGQDINLTAFVNCVCWHLKKLQCNYKITECLCRLLCHVSHTLWEHEHCFYFQLSDEHCGGQHTGCSSVFCFFFWRKLQKITVCYPTLGLAVFFGSLVSCSKTWHVTLDIQLQLERPSLCRALWG